MSKSIRVLFLYPNERGMSTVPPSVALMSTLLKNQGHELKLFDTTFYDFDDEISMEKSDEKKARALAYRPIVAEEKEKYYKRKKSIALDDFILMVEEYQPEFIAITCTETTFRRGLKFIDYIKEKKIPNLFGGVFPTFSPGLVMDNDCVDAVCVGEGENAIVDMAAAIANNESRLNITNCWVRDGDQIIKNKASKPIDINDNPIRIDVGLFGEDRFYRPMGGKVRRLLPVETHRGCPFTCTFCNSPSQNALFGQSFFRKKDMKLVKEEIDHYVKDWGVNYVYFWADTFLAWQPHEFEEFIKMYSEVKLPFWCQTRIETITKDKIEKLLDVGMDRMTFGMEHGNEKFRRDVVGRNYTNEMAIEKIQIVNDLNVCFSVNNIIGFPDETRELAFDTIELNREFRSDSLSCSIFVPFHGTELRKYAEEKGYVDKGVICTRSNADESMLKMPQWEKDDISRLRSVFSLYVKFPKDRWPEIEAAEFDEPLRDKLRDEYKQKFWTKSEAYIEDDL